MGEHDQRDHDERDRQAVRFLDHERRIFELEREFLERGRVSVLEHLVDGMQKPIDEFLLANRVAAGVKKELAEHARNRFTRWQKAGIACGAVIAVADFALSVAHLWN